MVLLAVLIVPTAVLIGAFSGSLEIRYEITPTELRVDSGGRFDGARTIPLAAIRDVTVMALGGGRRHRGTELPGYCTGVWSYPSIGDVWQATSCAGRGVVVQAVDEERPIVLTPRDPEQFAKSLAAHTPTLEALPPPNMSALRGGLVAMTVMMLASIGAVVAVAAIGPRRMRYVVDGGELRVETLFSRASWPASSLRARLHRPTRAWRVAGTAMPGYYTGRYRADGEGLRIYATDLSHGVLVEGPARLFLSPEDEPGFLDALAAAGASVERGRA